MNDENDVEVTDDEEWILLTIETSIEEYVNCDIDMMNSELFPNNELKEDELRGANIRDDEK